VCFVAAIVALLGNTGCGSTGPGPEAEECGPWPDWSSSLYRLPYPAGQEYRVNPANCSGEGHSGFWKHGYDFAMPIDVTASRAGTVPRLQSAD
jgi:hypothetical protein